MPLLPLDVPPQFEEQLVFVRSEELSPPARHGLFLKVSSAVEALSKAYQVNYTSRMTNLLWRHFEKRQKGAATNLPLKDGVSTWSLRGPFVCGAQIGVRRGRRALRAERSRQRSKTSHLKKRTSTRKTTFPSRQRTTASSQRRSYLKSRQRKNSVRASRIVHDDILSFLRKYCPEAKSKINWRYLLLSQRTPNSTLMLISCYFNQCRQPFCLILSE